jgi:non-canonical poly(A) RNA polymerase PAPD5/7
MLTSREANDISRGSYHVFKVRQTLRGAYEIMTASAYAQAGILHAQKAGRTHSLRGGGRCRPEEMSILSKLIGVTQEVSDDVDDGEEADG